MKNIMEYFIRNAVAVKVVLFAIVVFGFFSAKSYKYSMFPIMESKTIQISAAYPGSSPVEIEEGIIAKIENRLKGVEGIDEYRSSARENNGTVTIKIKEGYKPSKALEDIKNAVAQISSFPSGMEPAKVSLVSNRQRSISLLLSDINNQGLEALKEEAQKIEQDLLQFPVVSQVEVSGFPDREIVVELDEQSLKSYSLTLREVADKIRAHNVDVTGGLVKTDQEDYTIRAFYKKYDAASLSNIVIKSDGQKTVHLADVALIDEKWSETKRKGLLNGVRAVSISVYSTAEEDIFENTKVVKDYLAQYNENLHKEALVITYDASDNIAARKELLVVNGIEGILLVLLFLSLFLNPKLAFWVALGIPTSFLGMFIFASAFGITINMITLFGMILVVGILVDDGIVIAENVYLHYQQGKTATQAAVEGTLEVMPSVFSSVLTTVVAFGIFFFMEGDMASFFKELAIVVMLTLLVSLFEALFILPSHLVHALPKRGENKTPNFWDKIRTVVENALFWVRDTLYKPVLKLALAYSFFALCLLIALTLFTVQSLQKGTIKMALFPSVEPDFVSISIEMPTGASEMLIEEKANQVEKGIFKAAHYYDSLRTDSLKTIKYTYREQNNMGANFELRFLEADKRGKLSNTDILNKVQEFVGEVDGVENINYGSKMSFFGGFPIDISVESQNLVDLQKAEQEILLALRENQALKDVATDAPKGNKEIRLSLKDKAYTLGMTVTNVFSQVREGFFGYEVQRFQRGTDEVKIWVRYSRDYRSNIKNLEEMYIRTPAGVMIPLKEIANYKMERGIAQIKHQDGKRELSVVANLKNPQQEDVIRLMNGIQEEIINPVLRKYPSVTAFFKGQKKEADKTVKSAVVPIMAVFFLIFAIIAFTFRSFGHPILIILLSLFSLVGAAWGHYVHGLPLNIMSFFGVIALIGVVVNDSLVLVGKFNQNLRAGLLFQEALIEASLSRFRAIFLTTITTVAGLAPLIAETSFQAQFLIPVAVAITYGIAFSTLLTLLVLPVLVNLYNYAKLGTYWLWYAELPSRESQEREIKNVQQEHED